MLTGEQPEVNPQVAARLAEYGHEDFTATSCGRASARSSVACLPHTNLGVLSREDLARLREVTASQGLMLESVSERLMQTGPRGLADQASRAAPGDDPRGGRAEDPVHERDPRRDRRERAGADRLAGGARRRLHAEHGHIQEVILQNFVPHQRYYGQEPAEIADAAAREYWRTGVADGRPQLPLPGLGVPGEIEDMKRLIAETRRLMPDVGIQIPPNLADWWGELVAAGATDLGGLSANGDHISPEHPFPSPHQVRKELQRDGYALTERLCVYPEYIDPEWIAPGVLDTIKAQVLELHPAPRARVAPSRRRRSAWTSCRARSSADAPGTRSAQQELTALFAETRPEAIEEHARRPPTSCGRSSRGRRSRSWSTATSTSRTSAPSAAPSAASARASARPDAYEHDREEFARRVHEAVDYGASELCIQSGIHPDWTLEDYLGQPLDSHSNSIQRNSSS